MRKKKTFTMFITGCMLICWSEDAIITNLLILSPQITQCLQGLQVELHFQRGTVSILALWMLTFRERRQFNTFYCPGTVIYSTEGRIQEVNRKSEKGKRLSSGKWVIDNDPPFLRLLFQSTTHFSHNKSKAETSTTKDK